MTADNQDRLSRPYLISVTLLGFVLPIVAFFVEYITQGVPLTMALFGKWFVFSAVGLRLLLAGVKQALQPAFTAKEIFHIQLADCEPIVRELGFANLCFGILGVATLWMPEWRAASALTSGLYYRLAALMHLIKKPVGANERFALLTDMLIFGVLVTYLVICWLA